MGRFVNPDNSAFQAALNSRIYVDKTGLIVCMNEVLDSTDAYICNSRPRRFGKSYAANMLAAYYSKGAESEKMFSDLEIGKSEDFKKHLNKYDVIHIDVQWFLINCEDADNVVPYITRVVLDELREVYPEILRQEVVSLPDALSLVKDKTGRKFIIIIDEWDVLIRDESANKKVQDEYIRFLRGMFKGTEPTKYIQLAYLTGIFPIKKEKTQSALNNFREYSMLNAGCLASYIGFTEDEVRGLCKEYGMDFESTKAWYNGYLIDGKHMYNPNSVSMAMRRQEFDSYWRNTSSFASINTFITMNYAGLKDDIITMLSGGKVMVDTESFQNDLSEIYSKDDALTALIHLGYLAYDEDLLSAYIPNFEVAKAFQTALKTGSWIEISKSISKCDELLMATITGKEEKVAELIELAHDTYTSVLKYNDENSLSCVLTMAYFTAPAYYNVIREMPAGKGFADFVFIPRVNAGSRPAMIVELKYNKSADTAIKQIKEKKYQGALLGYQGKILLVGINYDVNGEKKKQHTCVIEEYIS